MKVNINGTWYDAAKQPIQLRLTAADKENIAKMSPECKNFIVYPESMDFEEVKKILKTKP